MRHLMKLLLIVLCFIIATGCKEPKQIVKDISLTNSQDSEDNVFAEVDTYIDIGNSLVIPSLDLPIKKPGQDISYGSFRMAPTLDGRVQVTVKANLTSIFKLQGGTIGLPNGSQLPIGGIDPRDVIEVPIKGINASIYVTSKNGIIMLGFATAIKQFDAIGTYMGANSNVFPGFNIKNVRGLAGAFTSSESGKSGVAIFTSFKSTISGNESIFLASGAKASEMLSVTPDSINRDAFEKFMFSSSLPNKLRQLKMQKAVKRLQKSGIKVLTPVID